MIDPAVATVRDTVEARQGDLKNAFTLGFRPRDLSAKTRDDAKTYVSDAPLDVVAPPGAFFVIRDRHERQLLMRNGRFHIGEGSLESQNGSKVMAISTAGVVGPLPIDPNRWTNVRIDPLGRIIGNALVDGAQSTHDETLGTLVLARLPAGTNPQTLDGVHILDTADLDPTFGSASQDGFGAIVVGHVDRGSVDVHVALARMRDAYEALNAVIAASSANAKFAKEAMDLVK